MISKATCAIADFPALLRVVAAQASTIEEQRQLPASLAVTLGQHGLFRMLVPRGLGGGELAPLEVLDIVEGLAAADGSAAWCVMVCATTGMLAAYLDPEAAHEIFGSADAIVGGVAAPRGTAAASGDGFEIRGRWSWASASAVCSWLMGGFRVDGESGPPRLAFFPAAQVQLLDDWNPIGLRGTGSGSFEVPTVHVPSRRTSSVLAKPRPGSSPVYAMPPAVMTALCIASVGCGMASAAFDGIRAIIDDAMLGTVTAAWARQHAARALLREQVALAWDKAMSGDALPDIMIAHLRLAAVHAARTSAEECRVLQDAVGGAGVSFSSRLGRCARDAQTLTAHALVSPRLYRQLGEQLFAAR
ncbi:acyl-CoA dehydrogenase family protein [Sphingomonas asaccharolytica]|uniref:acyl-CoA dehydrogenase family protein n=1 Tax=Sphingomonas asaccharolytica TaxID=40681 RepID=UPI00082B2CE7|nr:acyl-CoA dehydrogenase family protein [Sphingomonas asaccharolytica]